MSNPAREVSILDMIAGTNVASGGTLTAAGIDFTPGYESAGRFVMNIPTSSAGSVTATVQAGTALAAGYSTVGTINAALTPGLHTLEFDATARFVRAIITSTGGTAVASASIVAKPRTVTD